MEPGGGERPGWQERQGETGQADPAGKLWPGWGGVGCSVISLMVMSSHVKPTPLQSHPASSLLLPHSHLRSLEDAQELVIGTFPCDMAMGTTTRSPLSFKMAISHRSNLS